MIIDCVSDLHGHEPELKGGDLLIISGDLTRTDKTEQYERFCKWLGFLQYKTIVIIGGNHDKLLEKQGVDIFKQDSRIEYLCDSGIELEFIERDHDIFRKKKLKIWGSPWTLWFDKVNSLCDAFMLKTEKELDEKWQMIPNDIDILVTHCPPFDILDKTDRSWRFGSNSLRDRLIQCKPDLHVFGHIHEGYGIAKDKPEFPGITFVNAAIMTRDYKGTNNPITIDLKDY